MAEYTRTDIIDQSEFALDYIPEEFYSLISNTLTQYIPSVIAAGGQMCMLPTVIYTRDDATDKDEFDKLYEKIKKLASATEISGYISGCLITEKQVNGNYYHIAWNGVMSKSGYDFSTREKYVAKAISGVKQVEYTLYGALMSRIQ